MRILNRFFKYLAATIVLSCTLASSEIVRDDFNSNSNGWSGSGVSTNSGLLRINHDGYAEKTFDLDTSMANKEVMLKLKVYVPDAWENSGSAQDFFNIYINGTLTESFSYKDGTHTITLPVQLDSNGDITIKFNPDTTANDEYADIDYVALDDEIDTIYKDGFQDFKLINPSATRNVRGNFAVAGNTVMCLTNKTSGYGGTCQDSSYLYETSNRKVSKYLDIDSDDSTWNSTSSYITLPSSYNPDNGKGILWAGLFWQGRISLDTDYRMRYAIESGSGYSYVETGKDSGYGSLDIAEIEANKLKLKINTNAYNDIRAKELITYSSSNGTTYAAYADVTQILQDANLSEGKQVFTVANLTTNEGREPSPGVFGGWSLLVIYGENASGKVRNISVYDGFAKLPDEVKIKISGFKLPKSGEVSSLATFFSGEGEYRYGYQTEDHDSYDWMKISDQENSGYQFLPGPDGNPLPSTDAVGNRDNMFDGHLSGITRDSTPWYNNLQTNNDGVDIDLFDVSNVMRAYRDNNPFIDTIYLKAKSNNDYITPSMITFATELFAPQLCYDYDVRIGEGIVLPRNNREIHTSRWGSTPLRISTFIRSQTTDFPVTDTKYHVTFHSTATPAQRLDYIHGSSKVSPPDINTYLPAIETNPAIGEVGIGRNADINPSGGVIDTNESTFVRQDFNFVDGRFDGNFDINVNGLVQFDASNPPIPFSLSTAAGTLPRCPNDRRYGSTPAAFNVERVDSDAYDPVSQPEKRYPLYTQIAGKDFNVSVVSYRDDGSENFAIPHDTNTTVELELIDASFFENNTTTPYDQTCENPESKGDGAFINFGKDGIARNRVNVSIPDDIANFENNISIKNAAFRIWVLATTEINGTKVIVNHDCDKDPAGPRPLCFRDLYQTRIKSYDSNNYCRSACETSYAPDSCYDCLRIYFATPICSRDNFSIRPEAFRVTLLDNNETNNSSNVIKLTDNSSAATTPEQNLAAEYKYLLDINATLYNSDRRSDGYYNDHFKAADHLDSSQLGDKTKNNTIAALEFVGDTTNCADTDHRSLAIRMQNGKANDNTYLSNINVGDYNYWMIDSNWTIVDHAASPYKPFFGICNQNNTGAQCYDCDINNPTNSTRNAEGKLGCVIHSDLNGLDPLKNNNFIEIPLRFQPYKYDLTGITLSTPNGQNNFVYMNDIAPAPTRSMSARYSGRIRALGKNDGNLTNYTTLCAANDVQMDINFTASRYGTPIALNSILEANTFAPVPFQRNYVDSTLTPDIVDLNESNTVATVKKSEFKQDGNGTAFVDFYYNFKRPTSPSAVVNPVAITFLRKDANSTASMRAADLNTSGIPKGRVDINQTIDFLYGSIAAEQPIYIIPKSQNTIVINLWVNAYCDNNLSGGCPIHGLTGTSRPWIPNNMHVNPNDGIISNIADAQNKLVITPNSSVPLNNPTPVQLTIPASVARTYNTNVNVSVPVWLGGISIPTVWQGGGGWAGPGKTGLIVDTNASPDTYNKRLGW